MTTRNQLYNALDKLKLVIGALDEERLEWKQKFFDSQKENREIIAHDEGANEVYKQWGSFMENLAKNQANIFKIGQDHVMTISVSKLYKLAQKYGYKKV